MTPVVKRMLFIIKDLSSNTYVNFVKMLRKYARWIYLQSLFDTIIIQILSNIEKHNFNSSFFIFIY